MRLEVHVIYLRHPTCPSMRNPSGGAPQQKIRSTRIVKTCPSMRNPSGGAPELGDPAMPRDLPVSIDEKPVRRCAEGMPEIVPPEILCPSMRNPSGGAPIRWREICR